MTFEPLTTERRRRQTRDYLLQAAAQVFAQRGFHAATLDEVAAAAGFTKGAVYSNFKNKEDLFMALLEEAWAREMTALHEALQDSDVPPEERLSDFAQLVRGEIEQMPENWDTLYLEFALYALRNSSARTRLAQLDAENIRAVAEIIEAGRERLGIEPPEPADHVARIIVALFRGIGLMRSLDPDLADESLLASAMQFLTRGLGVDATEVDNAIGGHRSRSR
jgi:AcrR family transcriptional regulator